MSLLPDIDDAEEEALLKSDEDDAESDVSLEDLDSDDEDSEADLLKQFTEILERISGNPYNYDDYIMLTETAHKLNDLDKIRESYNVFSSVFPLAPDVWLKYIQNEESCSTSEYEIENVVKLFQKALNDYYSSNVALQLAKFLFKTSENTAQKIWPELLATYALDCRYGKEFFDLYRKYIDENSKLSPEEKFNCKIQSYVRELKIPLYDMENSHIDFQILFEKNKEQLTKIIEWDTIETYYKQAKEDLHEMKIFEKQLESVDQKFYQEKAKIYLNYLEMADKELDENVIQILYERMITDCCLDEKCWLEYIDFVSKRDATGKPEELEDFPIFHQTALDITKRSLRNCTWNVKLHIKQIFILEEMSRPKQEIQLAFETSLETGFSNPDSYVLLWLEYLSYLRRHTNYEIEKEIEVLRKNFDLSWNTLGKQFGVLADCNCEILQFWGRLEYGPFQNPEKARDLWEAVMDSSDNSTKSALWIEYIHMEMRYNPEYARKLFKKAVGTKNLDNPYSIISAWIRFERCNGSQKNLDYCEKYCENFLKDFASRQKFHHENVGKKDKKTLKRKSTGSIQNFPKKLKVENEKIEEKQFVKPSLPLPPSKISNVIKDHHENDEIDREKDHLRIFLSNLDYSVTEDEIKQGLPELTIMNIDLIKAANGRSRGFGYLELSSSDEVSKALELDGKMLKGRPLYISSVLRDKEKRQKFKYSEGLEPQKLFIKGIPHDATKEELQELFNRFGKVKDVRIVYHKSGRPKGIAYIEYEDENSASLAISKLDGYKLRDHNLMISISAPPPKPIQQQRTQTVNFKKMLGIGSSSQKPPVSQKQRMSLIPTAVQKNILSHNQESKLTINQSNGAPSLKSNADFRKLLNNS